MHRLLAEYEKERSFEFPAFLAVWEREDFRLLHCLLTSATDADDTESAYQTFHSTALGEATAQRPAVCRDHRAVPIAIVPPCPAV